MLEKLDSLRQQAEQAIASAADLRAIEDIRVKILGKKGELTQILRSMGQLPSEERPKMGKLVNEVRALLEGRLEEKDAFLKAKAEERRIASETLDVTVPGTRPVAGGMHPLSRMQEEIENIFIAMGFEVAEGPEIELDYYNFEMLNIPKGHPARDMQDSFYINDNILLRTHTSPVQARTMLSQKPPIQIICPGRVFRVDEVDATHSPVFHQCEGLVVDEGITIGHLRSTLSRFAKAYYGKDTRVRFRPSFFPFTEPSAEMDVSCYMCGGDDPNCRVCHGTGWIEILGCGMVNPKVLDMCGIDSTRYSGFAFGVGIDRLTTSKYSVSDMRTLFENDMRFLSQF